MYLVFPNFNLYSLTLLIFVLQGLIFALLLLKRYFSKKHLSDLFLSLLLIISGYHSTTYIIGFMDWYDTYRNTKINYWLINFLFAIGPLIYFYIKSLTQPYFKFRKIDYLHFLPALLYFIYRVSIFIYDASLPGFANVQNGWFISNIHQSYISPIIDVMTELSRIIYLILAGNQFVKYRKSIVQYFSNTYNVELNWLRNFLIIYTALYIFELFIEITDYSFFENYWKQRWWAFLASSLTMVYVGMMSYFSDLSKLYNLQAPTDSSTDKNLDSETKNEEVAQGLKIQVAAFMDAKKPYLNPEITLADLAKELHFSSNQLSQIINTEFGKNFNEFINEYRVEMFKSKVKDESVQHLSLLGIAMECGFNSKATFNRVFKKFTQVSPSEYLKNIQ
ncbi:MAG: helix-turn-helix domain-containing protein [Saprospiraceae bacterium]